MWRRRIARVDDFLDTEESAAALQQVLDMGVVEGASSAINQIDQLLAA